MQREICLIPPIRDSIEHGSPYKAICRFSSSASLTITEVVQLLFIHSKVMTELMQDRSSNFLNKLSL